jgi:hypothetical protein
MMERRNNKQRERERERAREKEREEKKKSGCRDKRVGPAPDSVSVSDDHRLFRSRLLMEANDVLTIGVGCRVSGVGCRVSNGIEN